MANTSQAKGTAHWVEAVAVGLLMLALTGLLAPLVPPAQSPDEMAHMGRAHLISHGEWLLETPSEQDSGGWMDPRLGEYLSLFVPLIQDAKTRLSDSQKDRMRSIEWGDDPRVFTSVAGTGYYLPVLYAPHALGFAIGKALDWHVHQTYWLVRWLVMVCAAVMVGVACQIWQPNLLVVLLMVLPMSLFQAVSPTLDGLSAALLILTMSLFWRQWHAKTPHIEWGDVAFGGCLLVLGTTRTHLLPLLALPMLLWVSRRGSALLMLAISIAFLTLAWVFWAIQTTRDTRVVRSFSTKETLMHYATHPAEFWQVLANTLKSGDQLAFYGRSFVGVLGWLDTPLPAWAYPVIGAGLMLAAVLSISPKGWSQDWLARVGLVTVGLTSVALVFVAMLLTWTPYPSEQVSGVQGRYFLLPVIVMAYALSGSTCTNRWTRLNTLATGFFGVFSVVVLAQTLLSRYH